MLTYAFLWFVENLHILGEKISTPQIVLEWENYKYDEWVPAVIFQFLK